MVENTIPILPCRDLASVLDFYTALGFTVTFQQRSPNPYGVVERGGIHLHFFGMKGYDPKSSYSTCYVQTTDVDGLHTEFRAALRAAYGRIPLRGLPRIGPLKTTSHGTRQFLMSDPGGNCVRVGQRVSEVVGHRRAPTALSRERCITPSSSPTPGTIRRRPRPFSTGRCDRATSSPGGPPAPARVAGRRRVPPRGRRDGEKPSRRGGRDPVELRGACDRPYGSRSARGAA
ncbi:hypothetical protein STSO111631_11005 [Stackebrandtia soli]